MRGRGKGKHKVKSNACDWMTASAAAEMSSLDELHS
jgi:hypothetical protein